VQQWPLEGTDPDEPETRFIVFNAESAEDVKAIVAKQRE
jgi:hypothetical protein